MNLLNYFDFIIENADVFRLYYSKSFKDILYRIRDNFDNSSDEYSIAQFLISAENSDQLVDKFTLIDVTDKNDTISFIQANRIIRKFPYLTDGVLTYDIKYDLNSEFWKSSLRTNISIGKWTRRIVKDVYKTTRYNNVMLEKFVNAYKSTFDLVNKIGDRFEVVSGEDIKKWYLSSNYKQIKGQLGNSCMKDKSKQSFFEIYTKNPEVCKLLILKDEDDDSKIIGRSLLWNLKNGKKYQDRIYMINDSDKLLFEKWAEKNDYLKHDAANWIDLEVQLSDNEYDEYPYMDTFIVYNPHTKVLKADDDLWPGQGYIKLQDINGGYRSSDVVYSEYHDDYIDRESAVECFTQYSETDWLEESTAIYLDYRDEWWAPGENIIWSEFHGENFLIDDVAHSERLNDYLWTESDLVIEIESNSYGDVDYVPKSRIDLYIEIDGKNYDKQNIIKDPYTDEWQFKDKMMDEYKTYHKYLSEKLEEELGKDKDVVTDKVIKKFKEGDYPDIKDIIKENPIYKNIWGVYWGLSKDKKPNEDDMICLLFAAIIGSTGIYYPHYIKKFSEDVYNKYNTWYNTDRRLTSRIHRFIDSFDYTVMGEDIYKIWLWFGL